MPPRARGVLQLEAKRRGRDTVIANLRQEGSLKALFPKVRGTTLDTVFLNTAGGLTGGDKMEIAISAQEGAHVVVSSQAAERAYCAQTDEIARTDVTIDVASAGRVEWMPQETILFDQAALTRKITVGLAADATALLVEPIVFGRVAMGESVRSLRLTDQWRVTRAGQLVFADAIRLIGDAKAIMARAAVAAGAGAMATILLAGPEATARAAQVELPDTSGMNLIADDLLLVRLLASDGYTLRQQMIPVLTALTDTPIPRVWRL